MNARVLSGLETAYRATLGEQDDTILVTREGRSMSIGICVDEARDERLARFAHELRNPLAVLGTAAELLAHYGGREPAIERISQIVARQTAVMRSLVEELLDVKRIHNGRLQLAMRTLDLRELARAALEDCRGDLERAGLQCDLVLDRQPVPVMGDSVKLAQVLGNLLANAAKFTPAPGSVRVAVERSGDSAHLIVSDTGIGISAELLPLIFDPYRQATLGCFGGLGLGLPIVKGLVELHGGQISAASAGPGKGCTMTIQLPVIAGAEAVRP